MGDILQSIFISAGTSALCTGALAYLLKAILYERLKHAIQYEYAEKLKQLEHSHNRQIEELRAQLQQSSFLQKEQLEHDRALFARFNECCSETLVREVCQTIADDGFYESNALTPIIALQRFIEKEENAFVDQVLREAVQVLDNQIAEFREIVSRTFFNCGDRYFVYPEAKHSPDPERRNEFEAARESAASAAERTLERFRDFRLLVKQRLLI